VPAAVAATCVTVCATLLIVVPTRRIVCDALRFDGIFRATFFAIERARFAPRLAIDFICVMRPPLRADDFFFVVVFVAALRVVFFAGDFFTFVVDRFAVDRFAVVFLAMQAPLDLSVVRYRL
jgi:hypothetical protein